MTKVNNVNVGKRGRDYRKAEDDLIRQFWYNTPYDKIAEALDPSRTPMSVIRRARVLGFVLTDNPGYIKPSKYWTPEQDARALELYEVYNDFRTVGNIIGMSREAVRSRVRLIQQRVIKMENKSEPKPIQIPMAEPKPYEPKPRFSRPSFFDEDVMTLARRKR